MTTQELWQSQSIEAPRIAPAYLRGRMDDAVRVARRRNLVEYGSAVIGVPVAIGLWFAYSNPWMRMGAVLLIIASVVYAWRWRSLATTAVAPADLGALDTLRFHRRELERQQAAWRGHWRWVVPLYAPPVGSIMYGSFLASGGGAAKLTSMIVVVAAGFALGVWAAESTAGKLRREIELLDLMTK